MPALLFVLALVALVDADMYLHNMRGSNNRLNEANRDRDNGNRCANCLACIEYDCSRMYVRLFDSQNNNRGGYNVGSLYFYEGEIVNLEWLAL